MNDTKNEIKGVLHALIMTEKVKVMSVPDRDRYQLNYSSVSKWLKQIVTENSHIAEPVQAPIYKWLTICQSKGRLVSFHVCVIKVNVCNTSQHHQ